MMRVFRCRHGHSILGATVQPVAVAALACLGMVGSSAQGDSSTPRMVIQSRSATTQHFYNQWSGTAWGARTLIATYPDEAKWVVLADCPKRNEMAIGLLDYAQDASIAFYSNGSFIAPVTVCTNTKTSDQRPLAVAYEQNSGDLMVAYFNNATNQIGYRTSTGTTLSAESSLALPTNSDVRFVQLVPKPKSDTIVYVSGNAVKDLVTATWNGSSWSAATTLINDMGPATDDKEAFSMTFERQSGDGLLVHGSNASGNMPVFRTFVGTTWGAQTLLPGGFNATQWVRLAARPNSDEVIVGAQEDGKTVYVNFWNGSAWNASSTTVSSDTGSIAARRFDVAYQPNGSAAVVLYSDNTGTPKYRVWNGSSWGAQQSAPTIGSVPLNIELSPGTWGAQIFAVIKESNWSLKAMTWDGTSWSTPVVINDNPGGQTDTIPFMISPPNNKLRLTAWRQVAPQ